jgi:hypothetical protein
MDVIFWVAVIWVNVYWLGLLYYASGAKECSRKLDQILIELKNPRAPR